MVIYIDPRKQAAGVMTQSSIDWETTDMSQQSGGTVYPTRPYSLRKKEEFVKTSEAKKAEIEILLKAELGAAKPDAQRVKRLQNIINDLSAMIKREREWIEHESRPSKELLEVMEMKRKRELINGKQH